MQGRPQGLAKLMELLITQSIKSKAACLTHLQAHLERQPA